MALNYIYTLVPGPGYIRLLPFIFANPFLAKRFDMIEEPGQAAIAFSVTSGYQSRVMVRVCFPKGTIGTPDF